METPNIFERVNVTGYNFAFFVVAIDHERQEVDLMPVSGDGTCLESVPFSAINPWRTSSENDE